MKQKDPRKSVKKRSFLLPEVLLSLMLVSVAGFPLLQSHSRWQRNSQERLVKMQLQMAASNNLIDLGIALKKGDLSRTGEGELSPIEVFVTGGKKSYQVKYKTVEEEHATVADNKGHIALVDVALILTSRRGETRVFTKIFCVTTP